MAQLLGPGGVIRLTVAAQKAFPAIDKTDFDLIDEAVDRITAAGMGYYFNLVNMPAWATEGKPVYVAGVEGSSCANLYRRLRAVIDADKARSRITQLYDTLLVREPTVAHVLSVILGDGVGGTSGAFTFMAEEFVAQYLAEFTSTWCWADPFTAAGPPHLWGDAPELDRFSAPRPQLRDASRIIRPDRKAVEYMGETVGARYSDAFMHGLGNEWDIRMFYYPIMFDGVNVPGGPNTFESVANDWYRPYFDGLTRAVNNATLTKRQVMTAGPETAYAGTLGRFLADPRAPEYCDEFDVVSVHGYGDGAKWPQDSFDQLRQYDKFMRTRFQPWIVGEIDGAEFDAEASSVTDLAQWFRTFRHMGLSAQGCTFNDGNKLIRNWTSGGAEWTETGKQIHDANTDANKRQRAMHA